jgi:hypothetical protein
MDDDKRVHYCLSDDGNINLCVKCYSLFLKRNGDKSTIIDDKKTTTSSDLSSSIINDFTHPFHFRSVSRSYCSCNRLYPFKDEPTAILYGKNWKGERKSIKPVMCEVVAFLDDEWLSESFPLTCTVNEMMNIFLRE